MAEIAYTAASVGSGDILIEWAAVTEADTFQPYNALDHSHACIQVGGTFGGATVVVNGSNDDSVYAGLSGIAGTAISVTAAAIKDIHEKPFYIQPAASAGTAQSLTVKLLLRR